MKKILFFFCCYVAAMSAAFAQHEPINHPDSLRFYKHAESVVRDAPFIFKGQKIKQKAVRGKDDEVIIIKQLLIVGLIKGSLIVGDTVEVSYGYGNAIWDNDTTYHYPIHATSPDVDWGGGAKPIFYFAKESGTTFYFANSKKSFNLYSTNPFSIGTYGWRFWFSYLIFKNDTGFLNYMNKILTPKEVLAPKEEIIIPPISERKMTRKKIKKRVKSKKINSEQGARFMPNKTFNITVVDDSTSNLSNYNNSGNGWYTMQVEIKGNPNEQSFLNYYQFDVTYDDFYFYANALNDASKIEIIQPTSLFYVNCAKTLIPNYTQTITSLAPNKFRIKVAIRQFTNCIGFNYWHNVLSDTPVYYYTIKFKAKDPSITCMPSVGKISNAIAYYDNVVNIEDAPANITPYLVQYGIKQFRTAPPLNPCVETPDSIGFSPRTIRAGFDEVLTLKAFAVINGVARQIPWFGVQNTACNILFRDANNPYNSTGGFKYAPILDKKDIVNWTPMEVKVKIPSLYTEDDDSKLGCAGSGNIIIVNKDGEALNTVTLPDGKLHIEYAVFNYEVGTGAAMTKKRALMVNQGCKNQYTLRCHTSINTLAMQRCTYKAAAHWNQKLGYEVFKIDSSALVNYTSSLTECIVYKVTLPDTSKTIMETSPKNDTNGENTTTGNAYFYNTGFDIGVNAKYIDSSKFQMDYPILDGTGNYVYNNTQDLLKTSYYQTMLHELGHGLGLTHCIDENHNETTREDKEVLYAYAQSSITLATNRRTLTTGTGNTLAGATRIINDAKNTAWTSTTYSTFAKATLSKLQTNTGAKTICGLGNSITLNTTLTVSPPNASTAGTLYDWRYGTASTFATNGTVFSGVNTPSLTVKYIAPPYTATNPNANQINYKCTATLNGCSVTSNFDTIKAADKVVLTPTPSHCTTDAAAWTIPAPTPAGGVFTAYNITAPNTSITAITSSITGGIATFNKTKFNPASTYKIVYSSTAAAVCNDETYMSTFASCNTLSNTAHKIYINEVYKDLTAYRNGGINNPCSTMKLNFTALGGFSVGDSLIVKLSNSSGLVDILLGSINQRVVGRYGFINAVSATLLSGKTDSIQLKNIARLVKLNASSTYRVGIFLKKTGTPALIEIGEISPGYLNFAAEPFYGCPVDNTGGGGTGGSGNRTAPTTFVAGEIALYPNPTADHFTLQTPEYEAATEMMIFDAQGRIIGKRNIFGTTNEIDTHELPNGLYFVRIAQGERSTVLKLVIVK